MVYLTRGKHLSADYKRDAHRVRTYFDTTQARERARNKETRKTALTRLAAMAPDDPDRPSVAASAPPRLVVPQFSPRERHALFTGGR
jgi:hypothetical protein